MILFKDISGHISNCRTENPLKFYTDAKDEAQIL